MHSGTLHLILLGRFEARWTAGGPVELISKKARALLAYLAVERGRPHTREKLATLLWGETGEERARHNLRQALSKIRQCCGPVITSRGDALEFDPESCTVDVIEFERRAVSDDPDELRSGLDLYGGDLLEGLNPREPGYEEWLLVSRRRLRELACRTADRMARVFIDNGRIDLAIEALEGRLGMDPACEPAHRELMKLFARTGRRTEALRQYRNCKEALERELGAGPEAETKALRDNILNEEPDSGNGEARRVPPPPSAAEHDRPMVAVLPFDNLSAPDDAYFADGIVEDIITALSCFHSLLVIARGSSFAYRGQEVSDRQIAAELGAQYLVRGSVQRAGNRVRINVQLLDAQAGLNLWGHRFDRQLGDVFAVQDEISATVVSTLAGRVEAASLARSRRAPPEMLEAYDYLLRGKEHHHRYTARDCRECISMFERAIECDPNFAIAHAWLACGLGQAMAFQPEEKDRLVDRSQAAAERGLELDENESECHRILAQVFLTRGDLKRSLWHQERALFLNPNDDRILCAMGEILAFTGRAKEAERWVRKAMRLNPYHPPRYWTHLARALFHLGRFDEALGALDNVARPRPDDLAYRIAANYRTGDGGAAGRALTELHQACPDFDAAGFVDSLPYEREEDRRALLDALKQVGAKPRKPRKKRSPDKGRA